MAEKFFSDKNLRFTLYDVHNVEEVIKYERFSDYNKESFDMILDTAKNIATTVMFPLFTEMDRNQPEYTGTTVKVHPAVRNFMLTCGEGGWINATFDAEHGGQQMPLSLYNASMFIWAAANYSMEAFPGLATGASSLIYKFATEDLQRKYADVMVTGKWQGTMAITEPEAGSSLSDVKTSATPTDKGYYLISGNKTFISTGDHDNTDNVVHLMLARVKGAPVGVKGLSLFVVPKYRLTENGGLEFNDVNCAGCYHKMGYKGSPIVQLSMGESDDCRGWLVGQENAGLSYMFHMMNEARINVGLAATGISSGAYYASLEYANERLQGRRNDEKDPTKPMIPIIEHADIRRMLLMQRAMIESSVSLLVYTSKLVDLAAVTEGEAKERCELLLDFLTPIMKSYPSEMGLISTSNALQIYGGYGYSSEFPAEQYMRDVRIHPIHEGTTGIQGMDLLGRKITIKKGAARKFFVEEVKKTIADASSIDRLKEYSKMLSDALNMWNETTDTLLAVAAKGELDRFLSDSTLYLEFSGILCMAWQWLVMGVAAQKNASKYDSNFIEGKMITMAYFFEYELSKNLGLSARLKKVDGLTLSMKSEYFED